MRDYDISCSGPKNADPKLAQNKYGGRVELIALSEDVVVICEKAEWLTSLPDEQLPNGKVVSLSGIKDAIQLLPSITDRVGDAKAVESGVYAETSVANAYDVIIKRSETTGRHVVEIIRRLRCVAVGV